MKNYKVDLKGQELLVCKDEKGNYTIQTPVKSDNKGNKYRESISNDQYGWRFTSVKIGDENDVFNFWLQKDGKMLYSSQRDGKILVVPTNDERYQKLGKFVYEAVKASLQKEVELLKNCDMPQLRREKLESELALLGYPSIQAVNYEQHDCSGFMVLRQMGEILEHYKTLGMVYRGSHGIVVNRAELPKVTDEQVRHDEAELMAQAAHNQRYLTQQLEWLSTVRSVPGEETFFMGMKEKLSPEEWDMYSKVVRRTAEMLIAINADIIPSNERRGIRDFSTLQGVRLEDEISSLIDSKSFAEACHIEDKFVKSEVENFAQSIEEMQLEANPMTKYSSITTALYARKREAETMRADREKYIKNYEEMNNMVKQIKRPEDLDEKKGYEPSDD